MTFAAILPRHRARAVALMLALLCAAPAALAQDLMTGFRLGVAETAARDEDLAAFYRDRGFEGVWTGGSAEAQTRRNALIAALSMVGAHGLPQDRFDVDGLIARLHAATAPAEQGRMEVELSRVFLDYARDVNTGILTPREVDSAIKRDVPLQDRQALLAGFIAAPSPAGYLRGLAPQAPEYTRLMRANLELRAMLDTGGWGPPVPGGALARGDSGPRVIALRDRLIAMGYLGRSVTMTYDGAIAGAVERFQAEHGMTVDGAAGVSMLAAVNVPVEARLQSVLVAMERERWMNIPRGDRHVWVNLTDFHASIVDFDRVTFTTRAVIGALAADRETPEFSDEMTNLVINPSWYVPRSITVNEYLPSMRANSGAAGHLQVIDRNGNVISRGSVNFSRYSASSFPYSLRQPPGPRNALGSVKFLFPNQWNIYLHDTPSQELFGREVRAFSHGCIRLDDPHDFAYVLLAAQETDPEDFFQSILRTGAERRVDLDTPVPVHLVYRTAFTDVTGALQFRADIYGRDARIWAALAREGVAIPAVRG